MSQSLYANPKESISFRNLKVKLNSNLELKSPDEASR